MSGIKATIVFQKNWDAVHAKNQDGSRKYRYIVNEGSSRSSKTRSIIQLYYLYGISNKQRRMSVWRSTKVDCKATVLKDMQEIYPGMPNYYKVVSLNKTDSIYTFSNTASTIEINGTDEPNRIHGYNGNVAWFCEPYDIGRDTFDQIDMRTTDFIVIDWNPKEDHWVEDLKKDPRTIVIHSTWKDNPFCPEEQKAKILSYQPVSMCDAVVSKVMSEPEAHAYNIETNALSLTDKQITELSRCRENERKHSASKFNWSVYGLGVKSERPNRIFHWEEISLDEYHKLDVPVYYGIDWGAVDPWGIVEVKYMDGALYCRELNYASENEIKATLTPIELEQVNARDEGLVCWHVERLGIPKNAVTVCDDNRPLKVRALRVAGWDYAITATKGQGSVIDGVEMLTNTRVYYVTGSEHLKYEQENYSRKVDRYGIVLEEPEDTNNHLIDPIRYVAVFLQLQGIIKTV